MAESVTVSILTQFNIGIRHTPFACVHVRVRLCLHPYKVKTWLIPHKAAESFGWMFLDGFDILKLHLHRLPAKAAKVSGSHFLKK